jgi:cytochrome c-type biogenesis protein CcmH
MTRFILLSTLMIGAVLVLLAPVLLRRSKQAANADVHEHNVRIARERLAELEKEQTRGDLSDEEFAQAKQDLQIALAQDLSGGEVGETQRSVGKITNLFTLAVLTLLMPLGVAAIYLQVGAPQHLELRGPGNPANQQVSDIADLAVKLEARLQEDPQNIEGWFLLGRTYMQLEQYANAVRAYETLYAKMPEDASAQLSLANALAMLHGGQLNARGVELLEKVLKTEPDSVTALWLLGQNAMRRNRPAEALDYWRRAYPLLAAEPQAQQQLGRMVEQLERGMGIAPQQVTQAETPAVVQNAQPGLTVSVDLDPAWRNKASPNDVVFVYAKALQGPPMPLAVARKSVADLPIIVKLDDRMAMLPQMKLSAFEQVLVGARISKTGQAIPQTGDLQSMEVQAGNKQVETIALVIDQLRK